MAGQMQTVTINGQYVINQVELDRKTLYTNPYLIVTEAEYTKHYYIEGQRVASKLGGGWDVAGYDPQQDHLDLDYSTLNDQLINRFTILEDCSGQQAGYVYLEHPFDAISHQLGDHNFEDVQYFYHSDHLGSSSFITDASGTVDQHLQYLPFGEPWIDQRTNTGIRFTFSGKEKDEETGYSYFGARYYNSDISIWLSVDPLSDKYPNLSAYAYVANNPIILFDPNGREIWILGEDGSRTPYVPGMVYNGNDEFTYQTISLYNKAYSDSKTARKHIDNLVSKENKYLVQLSKKSTFSPNDIIDFETGEIRSDGGTINFNPDGPGVPVQASKGSLTSKIEESNSLMTLLHETIHGSRHADGVYDPISLYKNTGVKIEEFETSHIENIIRSELEMPLRTHYQEGRYSDGRSTGKGAGFPLLKVKESIISNYLRDSRGEIYKY
jgi:RHS repeat-associated protein